MEEVALWVMVKDGWWCNQMMKMFKGGCIIVDEDKGDRFGCGYAWVWILLRKCNKCSMKMKIFLG